VRVWLVSMLVVHLNMILLYIWFASFQRDLVHFVAFYYIHTYVYVMYYVCII